MPPTPTGRSRHLDAIAPAVRALVRRRIDERDRQRADTGQKVDKVLADLAAAAEGRCACDCGAVITDSSPSAYYATAECQHRWMARHVDNPGEVYDRDDAACVIADELSRQSVQVRRRYEHTDHVHVSSDPPVGTGPECRRHLIYGPGQFPAALAYRRTCPACDDWMEPRIYAVDDDDVTTFGRAERIYLSRSGWEQECSSCGAALLGLVHVPTVHPETHPAGWTFELHTAYGRVRSTVTSLAMRRWATEPAREAYIADTWASMERDLVRFEREWRGRLHRAEAAMAQWAAGPPISADPLRGCLGDPLS